MTCIWVKSIYSSRLGMDGMLLKLVFISGVYSMFVKVIDRCPIETLRVPCNCEVTVFSLLVMMVFSSSMKFPS